MNIFENENENQSITLKTEAKIETFKNIPKSRLILDGLGIALLSIKNCKYEEAGFFKFI